MEQKQVTPGHSFQEIQHRLSSRFSCHSCLEEKNLKVQILREPAASPGKSSRRYLVGNPPLWDHYPVPRRHHLRPQLLPQNREKAWDPVNVGPQIRPTGIRAKLFQATEQGNADAP